MKTCYGTGPDANCGDCYLKSACYARFMSKKRYTDKELTKIYNQANNIAEGKSPPITTERIFAAMRYCLLFKGTPDQSGPSPCGEISIGDTSDSCTIQVQP